jgi:hypothetical protein
MGIADIKRAVITPLLRDVCLALAMSQRRKTTPYFYGQFSARMQGCARLSATVL